MKKINIVLEIEPEILNAFEESLRINFKVIDLKILPDTRELYEKDEHFRKILKGIKKSNLEKDRYINKHNNATH